MSKLYASNCGLARLEGVEQLTGILYLYLNDCALCEQELLRLRGEGGAGQGRQAGGGVGLPLKAGVRALAGHPDWPLLHSLRHLPCLHAALPRAQLKALDISGNPGCCEEVVEALEAGGWVGGWQQAG